LSPAVALVVAHLLAVVVRVATVATSAVKTLAAVHQQNQRSV